jgi:LDH2 family malate/lactate/ureidoglycolate dehydrogenase
MQKTLQAQELRAQAATILIAAGSSHEEAATVAANLVLANLSGHDSHGVGMLPRDVDAVLEGGLGPNTGVRVLLDIGTLLTLDGQRGYGQIVGSGGQRSTRSDKRGSIPPAQTDRPRHTRRRQRHAHRTDRPGQAWHASSL